MKHHNIALQVSAYEKLYHQAMQSDAHRQSCTVPLNELLFYQDIMRNGSQVHTDYQKLMAAHKGLQSNLKALKPRIMEMKESFDRELEKLTGQRKNL